MKTCISCGAEKPLSEYYGHSQMASKTLGRCKECHKKAMRAIYNERMKDPAWSERERTRQRLKERLKRKKRTGREHGTYVKPKQYAQSWLERNPEKRNAQIKAGNAIRDGRLVRQPCEVCGAAKVDAHHDDYAKPLDVRWLCRRHHAEHHLAMNIRKRMDEFMRKNPHPTP